MQTAAAAMGVVRGREETTCWGCRSSDSVRHVIRSCVHHMRIICSNHRGAQKNSPLSQIEAQQRTHPALPTLQENLLSHPLCVLFALSCGARCKIISVHTIPASKQGEEGNIRGRENRIFRDTEKKVLSREQSIPA